MDREWIILRTKTFRERVAESFLARKRVACFLPTRKQILRKGGLRASGQASPLFPGYIFVKADPEMSIDIRFVPGAIGPIIFNGALATVSFEELERIRGVASSGCPIDSHERVFAGEKVRITKGPLTGIAGDLLRVGNGLKFVLNVPLLNRSVSVEIDRNWIEPADS